MPSITINDVQKDLADYRLYAQTKIKLEELEKKIFQEIVYEGLFSRVRSGSHADSNRTVDSKVKEGRHVPKIIRKIKEKRTEPNVENSMIRTMLNSTLNASLVAMPDVENLEKIMTKLRDIQVPILTTMNSDVGD